MNKNASKQIFVQYCKERQLNTFKYKSAPLIDSAYYMRAVMSKSNSLSIVDLI